MISKRLCRKKIITSIILLLAGFLVFPLSVMAGEVDLDTVLEQLQAELHWDPLASQGMLIAGSHSLGFYIDPTADSVPILLNGKDLFYTKSPRMQEGRLVFPAAFMDTARSALSQAQADAAGSFRISAIVIDPGHGGKDPGAVVSHRIGGKNVQLQEKDITLQVSKDLREMLSRIYPEKKVLLTRETDIYPSLEDRVAMAHSIPVESDESVLFISIHVNASFNQNARGYEVWYLSPEYRRTVINEEQYTDITEVVPIINTMMEEEITTESIMMAQAILNRFNQTIGSLSPSRGLKAEEWFVVRNAKMPSVLVELGFLTNSEDAQLLNSASYLKKLSEALYKGIIDFITTFEQSGGFTNIR